MTGPAATGEKPKDSKPSRPSHLIFTLPAAKVVQQQGSNKPALTPKEALAAKTKAKQASVSKSKGADAPTAQAEAPREFDAELLSAGWEQAVEALRGAGESGSALVEAWAAKSNVEAVAAAAEADDTPASARKTARRALNILKARGVSIPSRPRVVRLADDRSGAEEATLLPPDATGTSAVTVTRREASGRYHIAEVIVREGVGVLHAGSGWLSGSQLKEGRARALESLGTAPVPVPVAWARHRIAQARKQNATSGQVIPLGFEGCRELVETAAEVEAKHPVADLEEQITAELVAEHAPKSLALHDEPEFRGWLPTRQAMDEALQGLGQKLGPDGLQDPAKVNAALREEIEAATDRFFSPEVRAVFAERMRDSAVSLRARRGDAAALGALAVARAIREAGLITSPPREIPFLTSFFNKALAMMAQQGGGQLRIPMPMGSVPQGAGEGEASDEASAEEGAAASNSDEPSGG
ncbi:hypothetical protein [Chondromyces crocatus]|uniref:Uncharacterized protein n=1 Tax=Chondromyces crocatus TaxID=52 RepID=A0A0K1ETL3_CHOCO|nr:hypothetical protein [Chondromyces crocatus]AKT44196.1 uncharacterized protein CMC5_084360 [Chondromyces crocatus]